MLKHKNILQENEMDWICRIQKNLFCKESLIEYSNWLSERNDERFQFIEELIKYINSNCTIELPKKENLEKEWLDAIGFELIEKMTEHKCLSFKDNIAVLAKPALRMSFILCKDEEIQIGGTKIGGNPDLPINFDWPRGNECSAIYNDDTKGETRLAGFLGQINLAEISHSVIDYMPTMGILSFFCFEDVENDNPDKIGVGCFYFQNIEDLERKNEPLELTEGNRIIEPEKIFFEETLDLPESYDSPWTEDFKFDVEEYKGFLEYFRDINFNNMFGFSRSTTGGDPTSTKEHQHLILLENNGGCRLHIQISKADLRSGKFGNIILGWVDFD